MPRFARSLRFRLLLASLTIEVFMLAMLVSNSMRLIDEHMIRQTERRITANELAYKTAVALPLASRDYATLREILDGWQQADDITYLAVTDTSGKVLASSQWPEGQALPTPSTQFKKGETHHLVFPIDILGQQYGALHYGLSLNFLEAARHDLLQQGALIAAAELFLSFLMLFAVSYWLTRHLAFLADASSRIAAGSYQLLPASAENDEVGLLTRNFNRMAQAVESRVTELSTHLARQKIILNTLGEGVYGLDKNGRCAFINPAALTMLGLTEGEVIGRDVHALFHHSHINGEPYPASECPVHMTCKDGQHRHMDDWFWRQDGSGFTVATTITALMLDGELQGAIVAFRDITETHQAAEALRDSRDRLAVFMNTLPDIVVLKDGDSRWQMINRAAESILRLKDFPWQGKNNQELALGRPEFLDFHASASRSDEAAWDKGDILLNIENIYSPGDKPRICEVRKIPIFGQNGQRKALMVIAHDITERKQAEEHLRIAATAFESQEGIFITDANSKIVRVNRAFTRITGFTAAEAEGQTPALLSSGHHDAVFFKAMHDAIAQTGGWQGEIWNRRKNGEVYPEWLTITVVAGELGEITHYVSTFTDITSRKTAEEEINNLAFYDPLTGLPNRRLLLDRLQQALASSTRTKRYCALLFIDLDNFKTLNDSLGHDIGDLLLQQVAQRLARCVRAGDTVARLGGDEFVLILEDMSENLQEAATQVETVGKKILASFCPFFQLGRDEHHSTPSIGITLFADHQVTMEELLKRADLAMYQAKAAGRNTLRFFDPEMQAVVATRVALEMGLREAIQKNQFHLFYQAQVVDEGRIIGAEALVRWQHPLRGMVSPAEFIPLAEETGLILALGNWVLETACAQLAVWAHQAGLAHLSVAVNVSAHQFRQPDFVEHVLAVLKSTGANPQRLKLELTESLLVSNVAEVIEKMFALKAKGVGFSLDDFGTGYSSLAYLKRLPLDQLKIDQSFVRDVLSDPNDASIVKTIIALAQNLGLGVIAEGVETSSQQEFLASSGCHAYQGYFFSRPLPVAEFEALATHNPRLL